MILTAIAFAISFMMVAFMLPRILILSLRKKLIDSVDARKVHSVPASRLGGIAFFPAILFAVLLTISTNNVLLPFIGPILPVSETLILDILALIMLFLIGIYDDIIGVSYRNKFVVQIFAALLIVSSGTYFRTFHGFFGIGVVPDYIGIVVTILFYVFVTNAINLIDGIDGLASLLSIMALLVFGILLINNNLVVESLMTMATLGALIPFCYSNVFGIKRGAHSKIFMGDTGALVVGAILGFTAVKVWNISYDTLNHPIDHIYYILAYTMLLVPCFDVIRIILHRYRAKKPLFMPDKNHIHHKFMALGYSARQALIYIICINAAFVVLNILLSLTLKITYIALIDVVVWSVMHILISKKIKIKTK
ncbi:MAG: MraY family glycosyltransferase [Rikenellaceae bacterium]